MEIARGTRRGREDRRRRDDRYDSISTTIATTTTTTDIMHFFVVVRIVSLLKTSQVAPAGRYESLQYAHKKEEG